MDEVFTKLKNKLREDREREYNNSSKDRLTKIISTKIRTTFIGAIAAFEERFGSLWGQGKLAVDLTEKERLMLEVWEEVRTQILNNGNNQLRALIKELETYTITWNRHSMNMPVKPLGG